MYLVRVDNGDTAKVSQASLAQQHTMRTYRVSLSDMLAAERVVERVSEGRPKLAGYFGGRKCVSGLQQQDGGREAGGQVGHQETRADGGAQ
jgi:hypothetical protein